MKPLRDSAFQRLIALAKPHWRQLLLAGGCNLDRLEMDDAVVPVAVTAAAPISEGHEIYRMFEAEKQSAAMTELPMLF